MNVIAERRRRRPGELGVHEPERKRVCRSSETFPQVINACYPLRKYAMDYWDMEQDLKQKDPTDFFSPQIMKEKPNSMGHLGHIMGFIEDQRALMQ
ncbi:uncharacterized protein C10orf143 homolog isoform X2 [Rhineura floridana]|uniref:uncharacterized protein C10orf143 homolog isoform X2 n=1 Tax=Rhineura floridana TaxID=261503 RepID=UPI002AC810B2|nr:uncharacterized protein C10orf143 homolog isoform X2 [Rhineura floridana]